MSEPKPGEVLGRMIRGYRDTQMVYLAAKLGIPDLLKDGPRSPAELADATGAHPGALHRLLRGFVVCGLLVQDETGRFALTALGQHLRSDVPGSRRGDAILAGDMNYPAWGAMHHAVQTGDPPFHHALGQGFFDLTAQRPDLNEYFNQSMVRGTNGMVEDILSAYDFSSAGTVVDIGGGYGAMLAAILKANPHANGILFDMPAVIANAGPHLESQGVADRCKTVAGSFFETVPPGGDIYTLKWIIHDWDDPSCQRILTHCRRAMADTAKLLVIERIMPERIEPTTDIVNGDLTMMALTTGRERTEAEFRTLFESAGFELRRTIATPSGRTILESVPKT